MPQDMEKKPFERGERGERRERGPRRERREPSEFQEKMVAIQQALREALDAVGAEGGFICIFDLSGAIPYINKNLCEDVTMKVRAKLGIPANAVPAANLLQGK